MKTQVLPAHANQSPADAGLRAADVLRQGGLVGFATETVYGVAALATRGEALERLRDLKDRPERPFSVHLGGAGQLPRYIRNVPAPAERLVRRAWPGPVTLLLPTGGALADETWQAAGLHEVLTHQNVLGLRCPQCPASEAMLADVDEPVVAASANRKGRPSPRNADEALAEMNGHIELLLDSGPTRYGQDSTIVRFDAAGGWTVVREGVCDRATVEDLMRLSILFVCTGNTCRSPMAEGLARKILAEGFGCEAAELGEKALIEVTSAGVFAMNGVPASREAVEAARRRGADIAGHLSRKATAELIRRADVVWCMTQGHADDVCAAVPSASGKVSRLIADADVPDPIGGTLEDYADVAERIECALNSHLGKDLP